MLIYFFVVSGFSVTLSCLNRYKKGLFSIRSFFVKRILRIYPPLIICISLCSIAAVCIFQPDHLENFFQSSVASLVGLNNILLYITGGYWNFANDLKPLFHTWYLGVDGQFYLFYPLIFSLLIVANRSITDFNRNTWQFFFSFDKYFL
ncbi:acyltransferase [Acaryochloris sp. 'Moss Beach']|uniref:acyltransferase family protein n=1 Tax=Acaryochloris sp. 'Moss Beach' TaxID=2740837 RepID=UPI001F1B6B7B|nr:acyltransferase [Acaryochloris sp. 'Moss Beach']UJB71711.1 acyltransferase [Acaryochloris sp. 'Moss Beach']